MKAILTYHSIDPSGSVVSVHPDRFRRHVELLAERSVPVLSIDAVSAPDCAEGVAMTFDDGFENFASDAWPALHDHGFPATVFVASEWVGRENSWDPSDARIPRLPLMGWDTLAELSGAGVEIGSHTRSHARLPTLSDAALADELESSKSTIAAWTGVDPRALAYPYGDYDARTAEAAGVAGYAVGVTTELRALDEPEPSPLTLPRLDAYYLAKPGVMEMWGAPALRRYLGVRRAARRVRAVLRPTGHRR